MVRPVDHVAERDVWGLMMASLLQLLHDRSRGAVRTRETVDAACALVADLVRFAGLPGLEDTLAKVGRLAGALGIPARGARRPPVTR